jgi:hypothetical protein
VNNSYFLNIYLKIKTLIKAPIILNKLPTISLLERKYLPELNKVPEKIEGCADFNRK